MDDLKRSYASVAATRVNQAHGVVLSTPSTEHLELAPLPVDGHNTTSQSEADRYETHPDQANVALGCSPSFLLGRPLVVDDTSPANGDVEEGQSDKASEIVNNYDGTVADERSAMADATGVPSDTSSTLPVSDLESTAAARDLQFSHNGTPLIMTMAESIAAAVNHVAATAAREHKSPEAWAVALRGVDTLSWFTETITNWLALHAVTPVAGYCQPSPRQSAASETNHPGMEPGLSPEGIAARQAAAIIAEKERERKGTAAAETESLPPDEFYLDDESWPSLGDTSRSTATSSITRSMHRATEPFEESEPIQSPEEHHWRDLVVRWISDSWSALCFSDRDDVVSAPIKHIGPAAVLAEIGFWYDWDGYNYSRTWRPLYPRPPFPCIQGANGNAYLRGQPIRTMWSLRNQNNPSSVRYDLSNGCPLYPVAAFPSWNLAMPPGTTRIGDDCDGFYCADLLGPDSHREVVECFDQLREAQGDCVVPQYIMILDPNMHLALAAPPKSFIRDKLDIDEDSDEPLSEAPPTVTNRPVPLWAATPFALVPDVFDPRASHTSARAVRLGPVNGLEVPAASEERVGRAIESILKASAPLLAGLRRPSVLLPGPLQVVCKAQRIFLQPGEFYEGVWHIDGEQENVVAVILYYYRYSMNILGGDIEFAGKEPSEVGLWNLDRISGDECLNHVHRGRAPVAEGTCVVFSNHQLVHRILTMVNTSDATQANRDFVALFIIDQREPVGSTLQPEVNATTRPAQGASTSPVVPPTNDDPANAVLEVHEKTVAENGSPCPLNDTIHSAASNDCDGRSFDHSNGTGTASGIEVSQSLYGNADRRSTFAERDHRRRLRLLDQLAPKASLACGSNLNGHSVHASGNGPLSWIGWIEDQTVQTDDDRTDCDRLLLHAAQPPPLLRGLSFAAESAMRRMPWDPDSLRAELILGRIDPNAVCAVVEVNSGVERCREKLPLVAALESGPDEDRTALATLLLEYGARIGRLVPPYCNESSYYYLDFGVRDALLELFGLDLREWYSVGTDQVALLLGLCLNLDDGAGRKMWDQHSSSVRDRLAVAGWTRFTFDALHQFANERAGPGALSEDETTSITSEYARGAQVVKLSLNMSDFLCACRFDAKGHATALPVKDTPRLVQWTPARHRLTAFWSREAVLTLLLISYRGNVCGVELQVPLDVWVAVLSFLRPFELGDRRRRMSFPCKVLADAPPATIYTGPHGTEAMRWMNGLVGQYRCGDQQTHIQPLDARYLIWKGTKYGHVKLELTANPNRLRVLDAAVAERTPVYALSMHIEVVHDGSDMEMGLISQLVLNGLETFVRVS